MFCVAPDEIVTVARAGAAEQASDTDIASIKGTTTHRFPISTAGLYSPGKRMTMARAPEDDRTGWLVIVAASGMASLRRRVGAQIGQAAIDVGIFPPRWQDEPGGQAGLELRGGRPVMPGSFAGLPAPWLGLVIPLVSVSQ